jgi:acyl-CoA dehydrogenase
LDFSLSERQTDWLKRAREFMRAEVHPAIPSVETELSRMGADRWQPSATIEALKSKAKAHGLWTLFLPPSREHATPDYRGAGLSNLEYALCAEEMGRVRWWAEVFNSSAPDTGNMEVLHQIRERRTKGRSKP